MTVTELLRSTPMFHGLSQASVEAVTEAAEERHLGRGDVLFRQDEEAESLFVVASGRIAIANRARDGRESVVALMEQGDIFGDMGLFDGRRSADARALEPSTVVVVPFDAVHRALDEEPAALWGLVSLLAQRLRLADQAIADSVFLDVAGRTAKRLLELAGDADEFGLPVTQEELAGMVGASRERVNKAIATFVRLGWIDQSDRRYTIKNRAELARRAQ